MLIRFVYVSPPKPEWLAMLDIFEWETWILFCVILIISGVSWDFFGKFTAESSAHKDAVLCWLNSWCVFLGVSANNRPEWHPLRMFFMGLTLYGLNVTTIYTSKLINVFTHPSSLDQIDTLEEIIESNLPIGMNYSIHFTISI